MAKDSTKLIADQAKEIADLKKQLARRQSQESKAMAEVVDYSKELQNIEEDRVNTWKKLAESQELSKIAIDDYSKKASSLSKEERKRELSVIREEKLLQKMLKERTKTLEIEKKRVKYQEQYAKATKKLNETQEKYKESIEDSLGFIDNIKNTIEEIPVIGGVLNKALGLDTLKEKVAESLTDVFSKQLNPAAAKTAESSKQMLDSLDGAGDAAADIASDAAGLAPDLETAAVGTEAVGAGLTGATGASAGLMAALAPILPIILAIYAAVKLFEKALELDQEVTDMARGFGISRKEAEHIHHELLGVAENTKVIGADAEELGKSFTELAKDMGSVNLVSAEMAETQVLLTKQYGLAGEEASKFQKLAMLSGQTAEQNVVAIQNITEDMTGGMMNYKDVMKDVASTSKAVQATFKGNIGQLTKAVITAKKFGKSLDDVKKITDGLLDIEGSLEREMEARVLTGKDLNLDQARLLKLKGDEAGAMEDIMKQMGGYEEIMKMAPYQQEALASAAGMTVDELVAGAEQQKLFNDLSKEAGHEIKSAADIRSEDLAKMSGTTAEQAKQLVLQEQQSSATEKMAKMGSKLSVMFTQLATPLMEMLEPLIQMTEDIFPVLKVSLGLTFAPLKIALSTIKLMVDAIKLLWDAISWVGSAINKYLGDPLGRIYNTIKAITGFFGKIGDKISGFWGGIKSFVANRGETKAEEVHDGMIAPDGGLMVSGQKGTYQLASDDTVVAGTGLGEAVNSMSPYNMLGNMMAGGNKGSESETVTLLKQIAAAMNQPVIVKIGNKVVNEIDKVQTMNRSYVGKVDNSYGAV